jgi:outer membrane lipoprotein LolB
MMSIVRQALRVGVAALLCMLVACAPVRTRSGAATPAAEAAQGAREAALAARVRWTLSAHIGVTTVRDSGSGDLEWQENAGSYAFTVHAPITGKIWKLHGDSNGAVLEGVEARPVSDTDVQRLLLDHVGWDVPLSSLRAWTFGLRVAGLPARVEYDERNLPVSIEQDGWRVEYRDWFAAGTVRGTDLALPKRIFATRGATKIKLAVYDWSLGE